MSRMTEIYLQDLGLTAEALDLEFVRRLQSRHIACYSFNSIAVQLGGTISIDGPDVFRKIVLEKRGGYCFEQNKLSFDMLASLGFTVRILLARVLLQRTTDVPRTHRINRLTLEGDEWIVDTGFGALGPRFPIQLAVGREQVQGEDCYRVVDSGSGEYRLEWRREGQFIPLYSFDLARYDEGDCLAAHHFSSTHPSAVFVNHLVAARRDEDTTWSLRDGTLHISRPQGGETRPLENAVQLRRVLEEHFLLITTGGDCDLLFERCIARRDHS